MPWCIRRVVRREEELIAEFAAREPRGIAVVEAAILIETGSYQAFRPHHPGVVRRRAAGGARFAARRRGGGRRARAHQPANAARRETEVCRFRHRYIRAERGYLAAGPGRLRSITENRNMKVLRPFLWAIVLVAGFLYVTSAAHWDVGRVLQPVRSVGRLWSEPTSAETAGFSADEQNNIAIYKNARDATVNITSVVYREDWFFRVYPAEGTGSGFIIKPTGEILTNNHVAHPRARPRPHPRKRRRALCLQPCFIRGRIAAAGIHRPPGAVHDVQGHL